MSNLALLGSASDIIDSLAAGEAVEIALPMGGVVKAFPRRVIDQYGNPMAGRDGSPLVDLLINSEGTAGGPVDVVIRMQETSFVHYVNKARGMVPRLQVMSQRLQLRSGRE